MRLEDIYLLGRRVPVGFSLQSDDKKLEFIRFPYNSREVISASLLVFAATLLLFTSLFLVNFTLAMTLAFLGMIISAVVYIYPTHIKYSHEMVEYNEQMLKAALSLANFVSMRTSMEYAVIKTTEQLKGILKREFTDITNELTRKEKTSLGDAIEPFIESWVKVNPVFVKSFRLLQTAMNAQEKDREGILRETIRTLMINYKIQGKRSTEELAANARNLVFFGVLLPVTSLMLLPLFSTFLTQFVTAGLLFFFFNVLFPVVILLVALNFANKRIQVDTIDLEESPGFRTLPWWSYLVALLVVVVFTIPGLVHLNTIDTSSPATVEREYQFLSVILVWLISFGIMAAIYMLATIYIRMHRKLWEDVKEIEDDLPHLLQNLSTLLSLNMPIENILPRIANEYSEEGFPKHPVVRVFREVSRKLMTSKEQLEIFIKDTLKEICPSIKVTNILVMIISFGRISQASATKAANLVREQTIALMELDDYIKTLLSETLALLSITITMLMPLLSAIAIIMALVIVKSLRFITEQLEQIWEAFGTQLTSLELVDVTQILPPTILEIIVCIYFIEMFLVLSLFKTKVNYGNDRYQFAKSIQSGVIGYVLFSIILVVGYYVMMEIFFKGVMGAG